MNTPRLLLMAVLLFAACADVSEEDDGFEALAERCGSTGCRFIRLPEGHKDIDAKRAALPRELHDRFFASTLTNALVTPAGDATYQWFVGIEGRGAIYKVHRGAPGSPVGTFHIYGALLDAWERRGYERGLGYFRDPVTEGYQEFGAPVETTPSIANGGLLRRRTFLMATDDFVEELELGDYLDSSRPGASSPWPLGCTILEYTQVGGNGQPFIYPDVSSEE